MNASLRADADGIINAAIDSARPDAAVCRALGEMRFPAGELVLVAVGKAAWSMANAACGVLGERVKRGAVITKYAHSRGPIASGIEICEAAHPVPDESSFAATKKAIEIVRGLNENDAVLFLVSGGGSALFESPLIPFSELRDVTAQLLGSGADIVEINTIRKRLSAVKGGRFAKLCEPARVFCVILSDIIGDPLDMIASGPAWPDSSTCADALAIVKKYSLSLSDGARALLEAETPKQLDNVEAHVTGSVTQLVRAAEEKCRELGYETVSLTASLACCARDAGDFLAATARFHADTKKPLAFIAGGETVVKLTGDGKGGRNQELALSAARQLAGLKNAAVFSVGSDGTDGPTDAAGGYCDGYTLAALSAAGIGLDDVLSRNDSYTALSAVGGLIKTGPTGTNVNDLCVALIRP